MQAIESAVIPIDQIYIGERARKQYGELSTIKETATTFMGQIQSLAVCKRDDPDQPYELLAGGRRFQAFKESGLTEVLVRIYPALSEPEKKSIELIENTARLDMNWVERVELTSRVHALHLEIYGELSYAGGENKGWSVKKTSALLGRSPAAVSKDLATAAALESAPELRECDSQRDADNLYARMKEDIVMEALEEQAAAVLDEIDQEEGLDTSLGTDPDEPETEAVRRRRIALNMTPYQRACLSAYKCQDIFEAMASLEEESYHLIEIDPPYGIDYSNNAPMQDGKGELQKQLNEQAFKDLDPSEYRSFIGQVLKETYRLAAPNSWTIVWFGMDPFYSATLQAILEAGYSCKGIPGIWCKITSNTSNRPSAYPDYYLGHVYEPFFYARKGSPCITRRARPDAFFYPSPKTRIHPNEKPKDLMADIYSTFGAKGNRVLIPFAGSGNGIPAAIESKMWVHAFDKSKEMRQKYVAKILEK